MYFVDHKFGLPCEFYMSESHLYLKG